MSIKRGDVGGTGDGTLNTIDQIVAQVASEIRLRTAEAKIDANRAEAAAVDALEYRDQAEQFKNQAENRATMADQAAISALDSSIQADISRAEAEAKAIEAAASAVDAEGFALQAADEANLALQYKNDAAQSAATAQQIVEELDFGTAATHDVTTSQTDTTLGRVLKVGDFGVGHTISIPEGADLNDYTIPGEYKQTTNAYAIPELNYPAQLAGVLKVAEVTDGCVQEYTTYGDTRRKFLRGIHDGVWSSWVEFYHTGNLSSSNYPIGVGQTWQVVTAQRAANTTYTNTTGRPIAIHVRTSIINDGVNIILEIDGVSLIGPSFGSGTGFTRSTSIFAIIPPGAEYRITGSTSLLQWVELR